MAWASVTIAGNLLEAPELALATALGLALASLRATSERRRLGLLGALGALAGFQFLVEINVGIVTAALAALTVIGATEASPGAWREHSRVRAALVAGVAFLVVLGTALVAAGQSVSNFASYVRGSFAVALGYAPAMSSSGGRQGEEWYAVVDVVLLAGVFRVGARRETCPGKGRRFRDARGMGVGGGEGGFRAPRPPRLDVLRALRRGALPGSAPTLPRTGSSRRDHSGCATGVYRQRWATSLAPFSPRGRPRSCPGSTATWSSSRDGTIKRRLHGSKSA